MKKEKNRPTKALKILLTSFLDSDNEVKGTLLKQLTPCPSWQPSTQTQQPSRLAQKKAANLLKQTNIINGNEVNGNSQTIELVISDYDDDESPSTPMSNRSPGNHINSIVGTNININSQISSITHSGRSRSNSTDSRSSPNAFNSPILDSCSTQADLGRTATPTNSIGFKGHAHLNGICVLVLQMGSIQNKIPRSTLMCCDEVLEQANLGSYRKQLRKTHFLFWAVPNFTLCVGFSDSFLRIKINQAEIPRFEITGRAPKNITSFPTEVWGGGEK